MENTNNSNVTQVTETSKKRGRPSGVRSPEAVQFDIDFAQKQVAKLNARLVEIAEEKALVEEKLAKHASNLSSLTIQLDTAKLAA